MAIYKYILGLSIGILLFSVSFGWYNPNDQISTMSPFNGLSPSFQTLGETLANKFVEKIEKSDDPNGLTNYYITLFTQMQHVLCNSYENRQSEDICGLIRGMRNVVSYDPRIVKLQSNIDKSPDLFSTEIKTFGLGGELNLSVICDLSEGVYSNRIDLPKYKEQFGEIGFVKRDSMVYWIESSEKPSEGLIADLLSWHGDLGGDSQPNGYSIYDYGVSWSIFDCQSYQQSSAYIKKESSGHAIAFKQDNFSIQTIDNDLKEEIYLWNITNNTVRLSE